MHKSGIIFIENYIAGGGDQVARHLINQLPFKRLTIYVNRGNDTSILLSGLMPPHVVVKQYDLITIAELSAWANSMKTPIMRTLSRMAGFAIRYPLALFSIAYFWIRFLRSDANIFLANNGGYPGAFYCRTATIAASLIPRISVFHVVHNMAEPAKGVTRYVEWFIDYLIDSCSKVITVSHATAERMSLVRNFSQPMRVIYNGIPDSVYTQPQKNSHFRVLHVGYFGLVKNQEMIVEALGELRRRGQTDVEVQFVGADLGDGYMDLCRARAHELGVEGQIQFSGFVDQIESYYERSNVLVMCSLVEGLPMAILEAMRANRPVISTDVGGISEQVEDGVTGFVIPAGDIFALVDKLVLLKDDINLQMRLGNAARAHYESKFSISRMALDYIKTLEIK